MNSLVITFDNSGHGHCLYSELIDLNQIGTLEITRANAIEFNNDRQVWEVIDLRGRVRFFSRFRSACLAWEQQYHERTN
jgi:hypothetical protein